MLDNDSGMARVKEVKGCLVFKAECIFPIITLTEGRHDRLLGYLGRSSRGDLAVS